ncbi:MAG: TonB-dependent receptor [Gemmatimonadaceae bacterium]|nr:TonB-dependent receptor [Gemmatimonadaceae bacterium]
MNSFPVARGRSTAGVVDQESRSGGERWAGEVVVAHRPGVPFDARSAIVPAGANAADFRQAERGFVRTQVAAAGGGALVPGRTYAFGAVEHGDENEDRVLSTARTSFLGREARRVTKLLGRVDHGWSPTQVTTLRLAGSRTAREGLGSGIVAPEADITTIRAGASVALVHRGSWRGGRIGHETALQAAGFRWHFPPTRSDFTRPQVTILDRDSIPVGVVGSSNFIFDETERQLQLRDTWTFALGDRHVLDVGVDAISSGFRLRAAGTNPNGAYEVIDNGDIPVGADGRYTLAAVPASVTVRRYTIDAAPQQVNLRQTTAAAWIEDRWRPTSALTVRAGLRWDVDDITGRGPSRTDLSAWQPRASVNWAVSPSTIVRGGVGIFAGRLPYAIYSDAIQFGPTGSRGPTRRRSVRGHSPRSSIVPRCRPARRASSSRSACARHGAGRRRSGGSDCSRRRSRWRWTRWSWRRASCRAAGISTRRRVASDRPTRSGSRWRSATRSARCHRYRAASVAARRPPRAGARTTRRSTPRCGGCRCRRWRSMRGGPGRGPAPTPKTSTSTPRKATTSRPSGPMRSTTAVIT